MGYTKEYTTRIIKTVHKIDFTEGSRALDIMDILKNVPKEAKLTGLMEEDGSYIMEFVEEKEEK
jgi:hypothetical protein